MLINRKKLCLAMAVAATCLASLIACAPQMTSHDTGVAGNAPDGGETLVFTWTVESDCKACHQKAAASLASLTCEAAQGEPSTTCMTCHTDAEGLSGAHQKVTLADTEGDQKRLKKTQVQPDSCLTCHNMDDLIAATANSTVLTDAEGLTVNPHEASSSLYNINGNHDDMSCSSCHKMHSEDPRETTAANYCESCHHQGVYKCYTCHS